MAVFRINNLPQTDNITSDDLLVMMDDPSGAQVTKQVSLSQIAEAIAQSGTGDITFNGSTISTANTDQDMTLTTNGDGDIYIGADKNMIFDMNAFSAKGILLQDSQEDGYDDEETPSVLHVGRIYHATGVMVIESDGRIDQLGSGGSGSGGDDPVYGGIWITNGQDTGFSVPPQDTALGAPGISNEHIQIRNDSKSWVFDNDGKLTYPDGTTNTGGTVIAPETYNIQSIDNTLIQTSANAQAKSWNFDTNGTLTLPQGSILSETNNTISLMPPTAASGQSLVIRPTMATWGLDSSGYIEYGSPITISVTLQSWAYFGTVNYTISGTGVTEQSLGRALTGKLTFVSTSGPDTETITWTIPANSNITEFTLTLTSVDGTRSTNEETQNDPALYYDFEENAMPTGQFITVTNNNVSNSEHSHVHLVAGDPENVDIYLGDDDQYVKIEKDGGNVVIGTDSNTNLWTFNTDGSIIFPNDTIQTSAGVTSDVALVSTTNSFAITNMVSISQANYDALVTKDSSTLYIIS